MNQFMLISFANYLNYPKSFFKKKVIEKNYLNINLD